ncbi:LutB/LldF family L-lactate oxidation iron-sulfur protein [Salisediminibacterium halotolerans]|uniref:LutB/LldF family L-lactate oxidation iron-sulfur protein n=1 Tax=Salisediminibacterium halotolerans TaxID=517425 RepID=UPI000EB3CFD2|nr:LutB/LldF family L-lactate oxidation iron-sulfur protein [Salisediminibacterium halotolerans]RLJ78371.1 L-lactate dehydrogenase complex protein LldF [Actinophytocola xinjiangensis]RPE88287.1 L-lactate dehydrogenase complex protein LldF [Salisediminibacterium halotolerans]TWG37347.1 L-lactate dehydrogenase complex protein LldF [Salisediminibacterium halotolerans]GEL06812.1 lactate utilization protein B [Salisediminibacterium halotolerans]
MSVKIGDDKFFDRVEKGIDNEFMRKAVREAQSRLEGRKSAIQEEMGNWEDWRELSEEIRQHTLENLDYYLEQFAENVAAQGGHVFFAETAEEANQYISGIIKEKDAKNVIKSKSMVTEEIGMNEKLEELGANVVESDLGEWILQLDDQDPPSHIVVPALHKNKEQIEETFREKRQYDQTSDPNELALFARKELRKDFLAADVGITGNNFAVAESGSISLVTNEGNARLATTLPKTQISVMGMERIVPTWEELDVLVTMLCNSAVGQKLTSYITGLTATKEDGDVDGPEEFHVVIIDNGRSKILGTKYQSALQCIRCAACINVCPVYRHIGGHSYGSIYPGPIGAVLTPLLEGYDEHKELPYASTLCAACTDACPVKIPLHELLVEHRKDIVEKTGKVGFAEKMAYKGFAYGATHPSLYSFGKNQAPGYISSISKSDEDGKGKGFGPAKMWTNIRDLPEKDKDDSFRKWFENRSKGEES